MRTVLLVEDEFGIADVLARVLEDEGYRVVTAGNGRRGLERLAESKPDLVVLDFMMPVTDGAAMGRAMRADPAYAGIPIIMMSAVSEATVRARFDGYTAFIRKPFLVPRFLDLIARTLGQ
ncbi:response regulator [Arenibaculum pallidiluteum]|uniref:response regulator n=1 Tax=Arenibaculum pallidiluteum TaxID=2812559 RepID=UPI001A97C714|nr:response regulator [Arenibaculum pallidiluteum]